MRNRDALFGFAIIGALLIGSSIWMFVLERFSLLQGTGTYQAFTLGIGIVLILWTYFRNR